MAFSKSFPRKVPGAPPEWVEITLTNEEEIAIDDAARRINFQILDESLCESKTLAIKHGINSEQNQTHLAIALFEKRASHAVFHKETKAKQKFDDRYQ